MSYGAPWEQVAGVSETAPLLDLEAPGLGNTETLAWGGSFGVWSLKKPEYTHSSAFRIWSTGSDLLAKHSLIIKSKF